MVVGDAHVFPGFLTPVPTQFFFPHASAEVRGKNSPERKFASTRNRTHNQHTESHMLTTEPPGRGSALESCSR